MSETQTGAANKEWEISRSQQRRRHPANSNFRMRKQTMKTVFSCRCEAKVLTSPPPFRVVFITHAHEIWRLYLSFFWNEVSIWPAQYVGRLIKILIVSSPTLILESDGYWRDGIFACFMTTLPWFIHSYSTSFRERYSTFFCLGQKEKQNAIWSYY